MLFGLPEVVSNEVFKMRCEGEQTHRLAPMRHQARRAHAEHHDRHHFGLVLAAASSMSVNPQTSISSGLLAR